MAAPPRPAAPPAPPVEVPHNGTAEATRPAGAAPAPPAAPRRRGSALRWLALAVLACLALGGGAIVGYRYWYDSVHFVSTDNAQIAGDLIQVGSLNAGRIGEVVYDVGAQVRQDDVVATLYAPVPVGITPSGSQRMEIRATDDSLIEVRSPIAGVVVARAANPGDTVPAGQTLLTVVDSRKLWVNANVEESQIRWIRPGQPVAIHCCRPRASRGTSPRRRNTSR